MERRSNNIGELDNSLWCPACTKATANNKRLVEGDADRSAKLLQRVGLLLVPLHYLGEQVLVVPIPSAQSPDQPDPI